MSEVLGSVAASGVPVTFDGVCKRYGSHVVLNELSFAASPGERVVLIGPSGSGKTTVLRSMMGYESIDSGVITVGDEGIRSPSRRRGDRRRSRRALCAARAQIGMVFQQFNLFPHMTVLQNITIGPRRAKSATPAEAIELAHALLAQVGLAAKADSYPGQLSGGQQQRVAIARALAMRPAVMLFDEVTSALDPETVGDVLRLIRELTESSPMTMLLVTHEMEFAAHVADRILFMEQGRIVEQGPPAQLFTAPQQDRTVQFLQRLGDRGA